MVIGKAIDKPTITVTNTTKKKKFYSHQSVHIVFEQNYTFFLIFRLAYFHILIKMNANVVMSCNHTRYSRSAYIAVFVNQMSVLSQMYSVDMYA